MAIEQSLEGLKTGEESQRLSNPWKEELCHMRAHMEHNPGSRGQRLWGAAQGNKVERKEEAHETPPCLLCLQTCLSEAETLIPYRQFCSLPPSPDPLHNTSSAEIVKGCDLPLSLHTTQLSLWMHPFRRRLSGCPLWGPDHTTCLDSALQFINSLLQLFL